MTKNQTITLSLAILSAGDLAGGGIAGFGFALLMFIQMREL